MTFQAHVDAFLQRFILEFGFWFFVRLLEELDLLIHVGYVEGEEESKTIAR